jgi:hypothetical protein
MFYTDLSSWFTDSLIKVYRKMSNVIEIVLTLSVADNLRGYASNVM